MEWAGLFNFIQSWGPSAISGVLVFVTVFLIRKVDAAGKEEKERSQKLKGCLEAQIKELRETSCKAQEEHGRRLSFVEMECVRRDAFYRELGGWKDDINRLSGQIADVGKGIIDLWKNKRQK
ncbi:MAG: hypothetical protein FWH38_06825 [Treponema sp.]|nr:hypothetical protein [Treponema sp.]